MADGRNVSLADLVLVPSLSLAGRGDQPDAREYRRNAGEFNGLGAIASQHPGHDPDHWNKEEDQPKAAEDTRSSSENQMT